MIKTKTFGEKKKLAAWRYQCFYFYFILFIFFALLVPIIGGLIVKAPSLHQFVPFAPLSSLVHHLVHHWSSVVRPTGRLPAASPRWFRVHAHTVYFIRASAGVRVLVCECWCAIAVYSLIKGTRVAWHGKTPTPARILSSSLPRSVKCACSCASRQTGACLVSYPRACEN